MPKASRGDGVPAELFLILKDDPVKVLHSISEKPSSGHRTGKAQFSLQTRKKTMLNNVQITHNYTHFTC